MDLLSAATTGPVLKVHVGRLNIRPIIPNWTTPHAHQSLAMWPCLGVTVPRRDLDNTQTLHHQRRSSSFHFSFLSPKCDRAVDRASLRTGSNYVPITFAPCLACETKFSPEPHKHHVALHKVLGNGLSTTFKAKPHVAASIGTRSFSPQTVVFRSLFRCRRKNCRNNCRSSPP